MFSKQHKIPQKLFVVRIYPSLSQLATVLGNISQKNEIPLQLSILGRLTANNTITKKGLEKIVANTKKQLSTVIENQFQFGYFNNPEIGFLFIAGHLMPTFLTKVDERELASLPSGLLGIFRGLGINSEDINSYLTELKNDSYCLIIRGESSVLDTIEPMLNLY